MHDLIGTYSSGARGQQFAESAAWNIRIEFREGCCMESVGTCNLFVDKALPSVPRMFVD